MKLGFSLPVAGPWATPDNLVTVAQRAEALGYSSVWVLQRLLYAVEPKNQYYGAPGPTWPKAFEHVLDPIVTLSYVAAATSRVRLGTSVLITPFYQPAVLAKLSGQIVKGTRSADMQEALIRQGADPVAQSTSTTRPQIRQIK